MKSFNLRLTLQTNLLEYHGIMSGNMVLRKNLVVVWQDGLYRLRSRRLQVRILSAILLQSKSNSDFCGASKSAVAIAVCHFSIFLKSEPFVAPFWCDWSTPENIRLARFSLLGDFSG